MGRSHLFLTIRFSLLRTITKYPLGLTIPHRWTSTPLSSRGENCRWTSVRLGWACSTSQAIRWTCRTSLLVGRVSSSTWSLTPSIHTGHSMSRRVLSGRSGRTQGLEPVAIWNRWLLPGWRDLRWAQECSYPCKASMCKRCSCSKTSAFLSRLSKPMSSYSSRSHYLSYRSHIARIQGILLSVRLNRALEQRARRRNRTIRLRPTPRSLALASRASPSRRPPQQLPSSCVSVSTSFCRLAS